MKAHFPTWKPPPLGSFCPNAHTPLSLSLSLCVYLFSEQQRVAGLSVKTDIMLLLQGSRLRVENVWVKIWRGRTCASAWPRQIFCCSKASASYSARCRATAHCSRSQISLIKWREALSAWALQVYTHWVSTSVKVRAADKSSQKAICVDCET